MAHGANIGGYRVLGVLGRGGMGVVYRATCPHTGEHVALKMVRRLETRHLEALRNEIQALMGLEHPGVVGVRAYGMTDEGPWMAMDLVEGDTLRAHLGRHPARSSDAPVDAHTTLDPDGLADDVLFEPAAPLSGHRIDAEVVGPVIDTLRQLCDSLAYLHDAGLVHRDLKPDNVVLGSRGPVLVDFGIVSGTPGIEEDRRVGTPGYLAPELLDGSPATPAADLYSLGCMLYEALTGRLPYTGRTSRELRWNIARAEVTPPSARVDGVPAALDDLVVSLLAPDPAHRLADATEVGRRLASLELAAPQAAK